MTTKKCATLKKGNTMKTGLLSVVLAAVLVLTGVFGLTACSAKTPEQEIQVDLAKICENLKNPRSAEFQQAAAAFIDLERFDIDQKAFARAWLDGYDYKVGDVNIIGDLAIVQIELTSKHPDPLDKVWLIQAQSEENPDSENSGAANEQIEEGLIRMMQEAPSATVSFSVGYMKSDDKWTIHTGGQRTLQLAILGELPNE
jgi:hypothetical protein